MSNPKKEEPDQKDEGMMVSFRLFEPYATALMAMAKAMRAKSHHEVARMLTIHAVGNDGGRQMLDAVLRIEEEMRVLRHGLAQSTRALLLNSNVELTEAEIDQWLDNKLWPDAKGGDHADHQ